MTFDRNWKILCSRFQTEDTLVGYERLSHGKIHDTYKIFGQKRDYILQRMNTRVFPDIISMMQNWHLVTAHILSRGGKTAELIPSSEGFYWEDPGQQSLWRMMLFIPSSIHFSSSPDKEIAFEAGRVLGEFHFYVSDMDVSHLNNVLKEFHHPAGYFRRFCEAFEKAPGEKKDNKILKNLHALYMKRRSRLEEGKESLQSAGQVLFPCHYDPKLSNILFHETTRKGICLIDLDTLSPGIMAFDFGDAVRSACSFERRKFLPDFFEAFFSGYLSGSRRFFPEENFSGFWEGVCLIPLELSLRYAEDYLRGGMYFSTMTPQDLLTQAGLLEAFTGEVEDLKDKCLRLMQTLYRNFR